MREAIRYRLEQVFGKDWWDWGVMMALSEDQKGPIRRYFDRYPAREEHLHLDPNHFPQIVEQNYNRSFSDAFDNPRDVQTILRRLVALRNEWAHDLSMSWDRVGWGADMMKHILVSLRRDEALEIENMVRDTAAANGDYTPPDRPLPDVEEPVGEAPPRDMPADQWDFWHQLVDSLQMTVEVGDNEHDPDNLANVTITVRNTVPDSSDVPAVHFRDVVIQRSGTPMWQGEGRDRREVRELQLGGMEPGDIQCMAVTVARPGLIAAEFKVSGVVDTERLFGFQRTAGMPSSVTGPLRQSFLERMDAVGIESFLEDILASTKALDSDRSFAEISEARATLREKPEAITGIQVAVKEIENDFSLSRDSVLGDRMGELRNTLEGFRGRLGSLDEAIGNTDLEAIQQTREDIRGVQLAVLRVEDAVRSVLAG